MCAILDANVASQVFGKGRPEAGVRFFEWISRGPGRMVVGGYLREELNRTQAREWVRQALIAGRVRSISDTISDALAKTLRQRCQYKSDDPHLLALAWISGARLLYSNDFLLQNEFKNKQFIDAQRGKVYSTIRDIRFRESHRKLLGRHDLCRADKRL